MQQEVGSWVVWLTPKKITSKKDGKDYEIYEGRVKIGDKEYDLSGFMNDIRGQEGKKMLKGKIREPYAKDTDGVAQDQKQQY
jgi:hypothetical protein